MKILSVYAICPGGVGMGSGFPLASSASNLGGVGMGRGLPLALSMLNLGGVGMGNGFPLGSAMKTASQRLLNNCLTELLTGSRIETANVSNARRTKMIFFMAKSLLTATMKKNRKSWGE